MTLLIVGKFVVSFIFFHYTENTFQSSTVNAIWRFLRFKRPLYLWPVSEYTNFSRKAEADYETLKNQHILR